MIMSLLGLIGKAASFVLPKLVGGAKAAAPVFKQAAVPAATIAAGTAIGTAIGTPGAPPVLPGVGAAGVGLPGAQRKRRRGRGFTARDIRQQKRLVKMLKDMNSMYPRPRATRSTGAHRH